MAANMQHMAGAGQMMPQQLRKPSTNQLQQIVYQNLVQHTQPFTGICWQANVPICDRMGKTMNLCVCFALSLARSATALGSANLLQHLQHLPCHEYRGPHQSH